MTLSARPPLVTGSVNYMGPMPTRPRYHANDVSRDVLNLQAHDVHIADARQGPAVPSLDREGFALLRHTSAVTDFLDPAVVAACYPAEIEQLVLKASGAAAVQITGRGILRFGERAAQSGRLDNSRPARFVHIDVSDSTARSFAERSNPQPQRRWRRFCLYNIWRCLSPPPQDIPLALCDARSVGAADLVPADAIFDAPGVPEWSFEGLTVAYNPEHRWHYFRDMQAGEAIVFVTNDSDPTRPHHVPHVAFDDPSCPGGVVPRSSIEIRAIAYWYD